MKAQFDDNMRTPLARVRGLGSARSGTTHFWHERLTSVAGIPLTIAFLFVAFALIGRSHATAVQTLGSTTGSLIMLLFVLNTTYHMWIGMQVIITDYVHHEIRKVVLLMANSFFCIVIGFACAYALLKLSSGV
jgi:succinate dehydrogenase / fumarate reductase membrane anchor subunit